MSHNEDAMVDAQRRIASALEGMEKASEHTARCLLIMAANLQSKEHPVAPVDTTTMQDTLIREAATQLWDWAMVQFQPRDPLPPLWFALGVALGRIVNGKRA